MRASSNHYRRILEWTLPVLLLLAAGARGNGQLSTFPGGGWSPNGEWIALNIPEHKELYVVPIRPAPVRVLMPVGMSLEMTSVFASGPADKKPTGSTGATAIPGGRSVRQIPSAGTGRLRLLEWAPDSESLVYTAERGRRYLFRLANETVRDLADTELLPWAKTKETTAAFSYTHAAGKTNSDEYAMRIIGPGGATLKQVVFQKPAEIRQIGVTRRRGEFVAPGGAYLLYPRQTADGWQLFRDPLAGETTPAAFTTASEWAPYVWRFTADGRYLCVADAVWLTYGAVDEWANAQRVSVKGMMVSPQWSPDGRYLAYTDKQSLFVVARQTNVPVKVSSFCSPRLWGWRGSRLYFGDARTSPADVHFVEAGDLTNVRPIARAGSWETAPHEIGISPDSRQVACLVANFDGSGHEHWQLWRLQLPATSDLSASTSATAIAGTSSGWELLYAVPTQP